MERYIIVFKNVAYCYAKLQNIQTKVKHKTTTTTTTCMLGIDKHLERQGKTVYLFSLSWR